MSNNNWTAKWEARFCLVKEIAGRHDDNGATLTPKQHKAVSKPSKRKLMRHILWMMDELWIFVDKGQEEKAGRWLGFIHGVLVAHKLVSINELADRSRRIEQLWS